MSRRRWLGEPNPLLVKELRGRMRGARAFVLLTVYLLLLSCLLTFIYYAYLSSMQASGVGADLAELGKALFAGVVLLEVFMVTAITPSLTAGAITGERERKTYELLRTTLLPARSLVLGKLAAGVIFVALLILSAVPLESLAFVLGGVVVEELLLAQFLLLVTAFVSASVGIFFSSLLRSTRAASALTYFVMFLITVGVPLTLLFFDTLWYGSLSTAEWLVYLLGSLSPVTAAVFAEQVFLEQGAIWFFRPPGTGGVVWMPSPWLVYSALYGAVALILLVVAVRRVRRQAQR